MNKGQKMDYSFHYKKLIERARTRKTPSGYIERHHIIPVCLGGTNDDDNIVSLLAEEHYCAHLLLAKIHKNNGLLWFACMMMTTGLHGRKNKIYSWVRKRHSEFMKIIQKDLWAKKAGFNSYIEQCRIIWDYYSKDLLTVQEISKKCKISKGNVRQSIGNFSKLHSLELELKELNFLNKSKAQSKGRKSFTEEQEKRRIDAVKKIDYESRTLKTGPRNGSNNPVYGLKWSKEKMTCPHCNKTVGGKNRWHFDNCRSRNKDENTENQID